MGTNESFSKNQLEKIYETYFDDIYRFFYIKLSSRENAEDLTSEVFLALAEKIRDEIVEIDSVRAYLYGIARNMLARHLRRKYTEVVTTNEKIDFFAYAQGVLAETTSDKKYTKFIRRFIDKLPRKQKLILHMRLVERLTLKTIAEKIGKNMNYVKTTQKRGIFNLKKYLAEDGL